MEGYSSGQCLGLSFKLNPESGWNRVLWIPRGFVEESKAMLVDISNLNRERLSRVYSPELQNQFLEQLTPEAKFKDYSVFNPCLNIVMELYPATEKVLFSTIKKTAERDMALTACALERYRLRHQDYPATLGELVPDFLPSVPRDIADGEALRYTRDSNDDYTLYSVGLIESERGPIKDSKKPAASHSNTVQQWSWPKVTGK